MFKKFLTIEHVPRITDFCSCIYVLGCKLCLVRLCDSGFGVAAVGDITIIIKIIIIIIFYYSSLYGSVFSLILAVHIRNM